MESILLLMSVNENYGTTYNIIILLFATSFILHNIVIGVQKRNKPRKSRWVY